MVKINNIAINGIAHIALSVKCLKISKVFYVELMPFLGLNIVHESNKSIYFIGSKTGILIQEIEKKKNIINVLTKQYRSSSFLL